MRKSPPQKLVLGVIGSSRLTEGREQKRCGSEHPCSRRWGAVEEKDLSVQCQKPGLSCSFSSQNPFSPLGLSGPCKVLSLLSNVSGPRVVLRLSPYS